MGETVSVNPELIGWAIDRSRLRPDKLAETFPSLDEWRRGERMPTFRELERFAHKTMTPLGYLFLKSPPIEELPIPDFRTVADKPIERPSPNLIETIQVMQRRQAWMREYMIDDGQNPLDFIGSAIDTRDTISLAAQIRNALDLELDWAESHASWENALKALRDSADRIGILVATSSFVGLNTRRLLDPQEFRGFVLCDDYAPLIFVNGVDSKSAQMFTLAHELVHLWTGQGGLFNLIQTRPYDSATETFCNQVAAEFLVPEHKLTRIWNDVGMDNRRFHTIAARFKVSPIAAARRAWDLGLISEKVFFAFYKQDQAEWARRKAQEKARSSSGGPSFYVLQDARLGKKFASAVVRATREGKLLYREAYELTDLKGTTFDRYAERLIQGTHG